MLVRLHNLGALDDGGVLINEVNSDITFLGRGARRVDAGDIEGCSGDNQPCLHGGAPSLGVGSGESVPMRLSAAVGRCLDKSNWRGNMHSEHRLEKRGTGVK